MAPKERLRQALSGYDAESRSRLLEAFTRQRPELKRLLQCHGVGPEDAERLLENVLLAVLPNVKSCDVHTLEDRISSLTEQHCIGW